MVATGLMFAPLERMFPHLSRQRLFRFEWREDLFYYLVSSMLVQLITFLALAPSTYINAHSNNFEALRAGVAGLPWLAQFLLAMLLTDPSVMQAHVGMVYIYASLVHANLRGDFNWLGKWLVVPRFHHWHHAIEAEGVDKNFAIHFPWLDRLFGTCYFPDSQWPQGYGVPEQVPNGYLAQMKYPFIRKSE